MGHVLGSPLSFLLFGWGWLVVTSLLGLAAFLGVVRGTPLPPTLRLLHAHGTLVGGLLQVLTGAALTATALSRAEKHRPSHLGLLLGLNLAAVALCAGSWWRHHDLLLTGGVLLALTAVFIIRSLRQGLRSLPGWSHTAAWYFGLVLFSLLAAIACGLVLAGGWFPMQHGLLRLGHVHAGLLLFFILGLVGVLQLVLPLLLQQPLRHPRLLRLTWMLLPPAAVGLLVSFLLASIPAQLIAGSCLLLTLGLCGWNLLRMWLQAGQPGSAAVDHIMTGCFLLVVMTMIGLALSINVLWTPPAMPYGSLHLLAYTHTALIGFILQTVVGGLSALVPAILVAQRVAQPKRRAAYHERLTQIMNRGRALQVVTISFGALGLVVVASLTWNAPLGSTLVQSGAWICFGLLLSHLTLVTVKLAQAVGTHPTDDHLGKP